MKKDKKPLSVLVTGASSGIGEALAMNLAQHGLEVILTARNVDRLIKVAASIHQFNGKAEIIVADLTREADRLHVYEEVIRRYGALDILVNNAGFGWYGYFDQMPWNTMKQMLQVNVEAVLHLTHLFLPSMRQRRHGNIIFIGSIAGQIPSQGVVVYSATKGFLDSFTTALHRELKRSGVHISLVCPGPVKTAFYENASKQLVGGHLPTEGIGVSAKRVAGVVWSLIQRPRRVVYVPAILSLTPWVEASLGWLMDLVGPLLLEAEGRKGNRE